jgi:autoinducer 2-degrading protein
MYVVCVTIFVIPEHVDEFIEATMKNAQATRLEAGNIRFDFLQADDDETRFFLYEAYKTPEDFIAHQQTDHYLTWRETVKDWMAQKRIGVRHTNIFPTDSDW